MDDLEEYYRRGEQAFRDSLHQLSGKLLKNVRLQVVAPEINLVVLEFADATFCIQGQIGGELLDLAAADPPTSDDSETGIRYQPFEAASALLGHEVSQARSIGEAWNGHGLEISFERLPTQTLVIQSIYAPDPPEDLNDCLRIAVVSYTYSAGP